MLLCCFSIAGFSQSKPEYNEFNDWNFRISPYFWFMGFKGTIYAPPQPSQAIEPEEQIEIDIGFKDIQNHIKFALMLAGEYRGKNFSFQFNTSSLILETEAFTPLELILQDILVNLTFFSGDVSVGYRIIKNEKFELDGLLGMKYVYFKIGVGASFIGIIPIEGERNQFYGDPIIGAKIRYYPGKKWEIFAYGDVGFILGNERSYQSFGGVLYKFTPTFNMALSYRYWGLDAPQDEAIYSGSVQGWLVKIGFQF